MRAEHLSGVPSARTHAAYMQACRTDADVPHAGKHLRAARKQNTPCDLIVNTSIVKVRLQNLEPPTPPLYLLLDRPSRDAELRWHVIGRLPLPAVHGC